jgi:hypothetical protein
MSSEYMTSEKPRGPADLAGAPDPAGPHGTQFSGDPASTRSRSWRSCTVAGAAAVALLGGAGVAVAASGPAAPANAAAVNVFQAPSPSGSHSGGPMHGFGFGPGGGISIAHGQIVLAKPGGGYRTIDIQSGTVAAVSTSSITLKSADGFSQSYAITGSTNVDAQRDGIASVKVGDRAFVIASVSGRTATAARVIDTTLLQQTHQQFG